jgi:hypothetical protein
VGYAGGAVGAAADVAMAGARVPACAARALAGTAAAATAAAAAAAARTDARSLQPATVADTADVGCYKPEGMRICGWKRRRAHNGSC